MKDGRLHSRYLTIILTRIPGHMKLTALDGFRAALLLAIYRELLTYGSHSWCDALGRLFPCWLLRGGGAVARSEASVLPYTSILSPRFSSAPLLFPFDLPAPGSR